MPVNVYFVVALGFNSALDKGSDRTEADVMEKIAVLPGVLSFGSVRAADGSKAGLVSVADEAARDALKPQLDALPIRYNYVSIASLVKDSAAAAKTEKKAKEPVTKVKKISATDLGVRTRTGAAAPAAAAAPAEKPQRGASSRGGRGGRKGGRGGAAVVVSGVAGEAPTATRAASAGGRGGRGGGRGGRRMPLHARVLAMLPPGVAPPPMAHAFGVTIANVVPAVTNKQLTSLLVGKVSEVMDVLRSEDMAVLYVPSEQDVVAAISALNGSTLEGRVLNVSRGTACCIPVPLSQHQMMQMQMQMHYDAVSHLYAGPPHAHALMAPPAAGEFDPAPAAGARKFAQIAGNAPALPVEAGAVAAPAAPAGAWAKAKLQDALKQSA